MTEQPDGEPRGSLPRGEVAGAYIRGGGGIDVDTRSVGRVVLWVTVAILLVLVFALGDAAVNDNSRVQGLKTRGVTTEATVTGCVGMAGGTGIVASGYTCRAAFELHGQAYDDVLRGTSALRPVGQALQAVVDPTAPTVLYTATSVSGPRTSWRAFLPAASTLLVVLLILAAACRRRRRHRRMAGVPRPSQQRRRGAPRRRGRRISAAETSTQI